MNGVDELKSRDGEEFSQVFIIHLRSVYSKNAFIPHGFFIGF